MQPQNAEQWNLRYMIAEAERMDGKISLDERGNIMVTYPDGTYGILTEQAPRYKVADGKRRGFNGKQPRTSDGVKHPVTVYLPDGRTYDFAHKSKTTVDRDVYFTKSGELRIKTKISDLKPSNDMNPDA